jgi:hypothetical protein
MKKLLILVLVVMMMLVFSAVAHATKHAFPEFAAHGFSLDVPNGWSVTEDKLDNKFDFNSPDGSIVITRIGGTESITLLYASSEGLCASAFADIVAGLLEGSKPVINGDGDFEFTYTFNGAETDVRTRHIGHLGVVMESRNGFDDILAILGTL